MTSGRSLPASFHPLKYADAGREIKGTLPVAGMRRLGGSLASHDGRADVELRFHRDGARRPVAVGRIEAALMVTCQRCMKPMRLELSLDVALGFAESEQQAEALPEELDPLVVDDEPVRLAELVEDELILGLPVIAMHPADSPDCHGVATAPGTEPTDVRDGADSNDNPFAVLEALKQGKSDTDQH